MAVEFYVVLHQIFCMKRAEKHTLKFVTRNL